MLPYLTMPSLLTGLIDAILPPNCVLCRTYHPRTRTHPVCPSCILTLPFNTPPFCLKCSRHINGTNPNGICTFCRHHSPSFDSAFGLTRYEGSVQSLLHRFKFHDKTSLRHTFADIFHTCVTRYSIFFHPDNILMPIPLHPVRLRERGYDQALLLAEAISSVNCLSVDHASLVRTRNTPHQTGLNQKERFTNITDAFKISTSSTVLNKKIILVDDLLTTGATASEAAKALKAAGAAEVSVLTLAIT